MSVILNYYRLSLTITNLVVGNKELNVSGAFEDVLPIVSGGKSQKVVGSSLVVLRYHCLSLATTDLIGNNSH